MSLIIRVFGFLTYPMFWVMLKMLVLWAPKGKHLALGVLNLLKCIIIDDTSRHEWLVYTKAELDCLLSNVD